MTQNAGRKRRRSEIDTAPETNKHAERPEPNEPQLCKKCQSLDLDKIFATKIVGSGPSDWQLIEGGFRTRPSSGSACDLCAFFDDVKPNTALPSWLPYLADLGLWALSTLNIFNIPRGIVGDTVMLQLKPPAHGFPNHVLLRGHVIMECLPHPSPKLISGRRIGPQVDFGVVSSWLDFCRAHHTRLCHQPTSDGISIPGFRVIDCAMRKTVPWSSVEESAEFAALSYVWGDHTDDCTVVNFDLPKKLPRVIGDALEVTEQLGFKYLWVDRYCIPENDAQERHDQIARMNLIYGSAAITIIAAAGTDPTYGLPGVRQTPRQKQPCVRIGRRTLIATSLNMASQVESSKWASRGWTYQEAYLSRRRLVFTDEMVYFHCRAKHCLETVSYPLEALHTKDQQRLRDSVKVSRVWPLRGLGKYPADLDDRIEEYATKKLTFPSDGLNAFQGVLAKFNVGERPVRSICGVPLFAADSPTASLVVGMSWAIRYGDMTEYPNPVHHIKRRPGIPSWSWAGWDLDNPEFGWRVRYGLYDGSEERKKFRADKATLNPTTPFVNIAVQMSDGSVAPWDKVWAGLDKELMGRPLPEVLHISGYTADARIRLKPLPIELRDCQLINPSDNGPSPLVQSNIFLDIEATTSSILDLTQRMGIQPDHVRASEHFFNFRFVILGFMEVNRTRGSIALGLVLRRRDESSDVWERVNAFVQKTSPLSSLIVPGTTNKLKEGEDGRTWTWRETRVG